jgi:hypothetical protein
MYLVRYCTRYLAKVPYKEPWTQGTLSGSVLYDSAKVPLRYLVSVGVAPDGLRRLIPASEGPAFRAASTSLERGTVFLWSI